MSSPKPIKDGSDRTEINHTLLMARGRVLDCMRDVLGDLWVGELYRIKPLKNLLKDLRLLADAMCKFIGHHTGHESFLCSLPEVTFQINEMINSKWSRFNPMSHKRLRGLTNELLMQIQEFMGEKKL